MIRAVQVSAVNGHFRASLLGDPALFGTGPTRDDAVESLKRSFGSHVHRGDIVLVDFEDALPQRSPFPRYTPEEDLLMQEMVAEIYRERDREAVAGSDE